MEFLALRSGVESNAKKPQSRLQQRAPAFLQLDAGGVSQFEWENDAAVADAAAASSSYPTQAPILLLSPLVISPPPLWEATGDAGTQSFIHQETRPSSLSPPYDGWRHPALPVVMMEPASLAPLFQLQCGMMQNQLQ